MFTKHLYKPTHVHLPSWGAPVSSSPPPCATVRAAAANSSSLAACSSDSAFVMPSSRSRPMGPPCKKKKVSHANSGKTIHGEGVHAQGSREVRDDSARQFQHPNARSMWHTAAPNSPSLGSSSREHTARTRSPTSHTRDRARCTQYSCHVFINASACAGGTSLCALNSSLTYCSARARKCGVKP